MTGQMKRGILELCILQAIGSKERYGYEVMKEITAAFPEVTESTAYAVLRRLHSTGKLEARQGGQGETRRKYYRLTTQGEKGLEEARKNWKELRIAASRFGL